MEDLNTIKGRLRYITKRLSRKGSYDCEFAAPSFKVKALCTNGVIVHNIDRSTSNEAVDLALGEVGSLEGKNKQDVVLKISIKDGISVVSRRNKKELFNYSIHHVGYCNVDKRYPQIFVFIATEDQGNLKCHIFLCDDKQKARAICLTMAKAFENSFSNWQKSKEMNNNSIDRRRSDGLYPQKPNKLQLQKRRASDFVTTLPSQKRIDIRRSSADAVPEHSSSANSIDDESISSEKDRAFETFLSKSVEREKPSLLRRGSTDWDAIEKDEEVARKMEGDLILWESFDQD